MYSIFVSYRSLRHTDSVEIWGLGKILTLEFVQHFAADVW